MKGKMLTIWSLVWLLAAVLFIAGGALNLTQRAVGKLPPTDGVRWVQKPEGIYAEKVLPGLSGARAGIVPGDRLIGISLDEKTFEEVTSPADVAMYLDVAGLEGSLVYSVQRTSYSFADNYYFADLTRIDSLPRWPNSVILMSIVGLIWLGVGLFVLFKQGARTPFVLHFATVCLAAFIFHVYKPLGLGRDLDLGISLLDDIAFVFFVPLFIHFCLRYPVHSEIFDIQRWKTLAIYGPATIISVASLVLSLAFPIIDAISPKTAMVEWVANVTDKFDLFGTLFQVSFYHFIGGISVGAGILLWRYFTNNQTMVRQRLKWALGGTIVAIIPVAAVAFTRQFIYLPDDFLISSLATLPLALIPLSFGHSVVRYRLMDVDVVMRRAFVYALTTIAIAAMIGGVALGLVFLAIGENLTTTEIVLRGLIAVIAMAAIVLLSEPLKKFLQERTERFFYGERYDLRRGLLDFGKTLSATTSPDALLNALVSRLQQVLAVEKVAVFLEDETADGGYRIAQSINLTPGYSVPSDFRQMIREKSAKKGIVRADELDLLDIETTDFQNLIRQELHYYVPCVARGNMVAVLGLGRGEDGSLLSSEDLDILQTISGYAAVAIENSHLYQEQAKRADELALLKEFNESIVESVNVGLLAVDENGVVTRCNSMFEDMLGTRRDAVIGKPVETLFEETFSATLLQVLGKSKWHLSDLRHAYKLHTRNVKGKALILNLAVAPLRAVTIGQTGAIIVLENVTARVKLEESLQQSEKLSSIGLLAAGVAHEVNTPLTGVSSYTQMLLGMIPESDPKHALLEKVRKQTDRASNIVNNLLNFSRVGKPSEFGELDVNGLLDNTLQLLEPQLRKSNIQIVKDYAPTAPKLNGDAGKLQQVFTNLILNARDAMFDGGQITLSTSNGGSSVFVKVQDTGAGIEPENLGKIFDPFFTTKEVGSGTGLGLAVTYGIVQEHSGAIQTTSEVGQGTTFTLEFPAAQKRRRRAAS